MAYSTLPRLKNKKSIEELQSIEWAAGLALVAYGLKIGIRANDAKLLERLLDHLPPNWQVAKSPVVDRLYSIVKSKKSRQPQLPYTLYRDDEKLLATKTLKGLGDYFESDVQLYVAEFAPKRVFIHAGAVAWQGKAIIIPGRSFSGKTSLVAAFIKAGATYYSDEYAVLDERGLLHAYPRKLSVREGERFQGIKYSAEKLGATVGSKPLPVGVVIVSRYRRGARWQPKSLSAGKAILALLNNTVSARRQPEIAISTLKRAINGAQLLKSARGEAREVVEQLIGMLKQGDIKI
ncbi:MAG: hypothetical protein AB1757_20425 [Acidobacteriota bacterium]